MIEDDAGRNFRGLDAREAQEALKEELAEEITEAKTHKENGTAAVTEKPEETQTEKAEATEGALPEVAADPVVEWSEEELAEHARMVEALLFAAAEPLDEKSIADRLPTGAAISELIARVAADYEGGGVNLVKIEHKWRFVTAADVAHVLQKEKTTQRKLSRAALETLAIIAYHQPCTRADIEDVRGVQVAKGSLDQLLEIGWVKMRGKRRDAPGRPTLYGTSEGFLEHFGLEGVADLPGLADLKAAGMLDARLPPGFSVPTPTDSDDDDIDEDEDSGEFAQDFLDEDADEAADA
ncbi:SMC-Scp complex subunit ScpB [Hyphococcus sp.]|uniref:SMC-Scp complex subunit ScpB n=1 Tax=Hyphococcus sp. TaxID=2038636 RepID=UPI00208263CB|nr:MAG: segregation and condensation protein B [Marinicaulis sp.]